MSEPWTMSDADLAVFLGFTAEDLERVPNLISGMKPEKRRAFEHMASVVVDLNMGVVPEGVIVCRPKCLRGDNG